MDVRHTGDGHEIIIPGLTDKGPVALFNEDARQVGIHCQDCWTPDVVYVITKTDHPVFRTGGYCFNCLEKRVRSSRMIPFPMEIDLLKRLKAALGLPETALPRGFKRI